MDERTFRRDGSRMGEPMMRDPIGIPREPGRSPVDDRTLGELFSELTDEARTLVRQEIALAKLEVRDKATRSGRYVGLAAGGGLIAYVGLMALVAGVILLLGTFMPVWLSALIVGVVIAAVGYSLVQKGIKGLKTMNFSLERTVETLQEDKRWLKEEMRS